MTTPDIITLAESTLIGPYGLIRKVQDLLIGPSDPRVFLSASVLASLEQVCGVSVPGHQGAAGFSRREATAGAIGEAIERYCSAIWDWNELIYASQNELIGLGEVLGMDRFALYTEEVYNDPRLPLVRWDADARCHWVRGKSMRDDSLCFLPGALIYIPYQVRFPQQSDFFAVSVSSGQACHTDRNSALLSGLCELIERDAFMITWMRKIPPRRIVIEDDALLTEMYERHFAHCNLEFHVLDITLDLHVPTVLVIAIGVGARGRFAAVGASTRVDRREAVAKALKEATQGAAWARDLVEQRADWVAAPDYDNLILFEDHVRLYCEPEMLRHLDFLLETPLRQAVDAPDERSAAEGIAHCLSELAAAELEAYVVDLTSPELAELGLFVPKVMVPGLVHLTAVHRMPALATPRYSSVPGRLGLTDPVHALFNPIPHPFP